MAQDSWPSPNHNTRNVTEAEYERIAARFSDDGVDGDPTGTALLSPGAGLQVVVRAGVYASLRGFAWTSGTVDVPLTLSANASGATRYDLIVLRLDRATWDVRAVVKEGTPGSGAATLTQDVGDTGVYEILLGYATIPNGAVTVTATDEPHYIGGRIRPADDGKAPPNPRLGDIQFRPNTGAWRGWNGTNYVSVYESTGLLPLGPGFGTWEVVYATSGMRHNGWVWARLWVRRTGSTFNSTDNDGSKLATLPSQLISSYNNYFVGKYTNEATSRIEVRNDGEIWAGPPSSNVTPGRELRVTVSYPQIA